MSFYDEVSAGKIKESDVTDIGDIVNKVKAGRDNENQIIVYAVGGMPTEDVAWGCKMLENAKKNDIGTKLTLWDKPEWV